jgi:Transposase and inactivated derivatives
MKSKRKFSSSFKAKVALEALKEQESISSLAQRYDLHPNQISSWKGEFIDRSSTIFDSSSKRVKKDTDVEKQKLYEVIGQQKIEIDFLKKALS